MEKILVLDPEQSIQELYAKELQGRVAIVTALSLKEAYEKFHSEKQDLAAIVVASLIIAEMPSMFISTIKGSFSGPIIGTSRIESLQKNLQELGCSHTCSKNEVPKVLTDLLHL